ncbi:MAG TPA: MBL fold metallo-hydrolase [Smithellaceae bacterium]|jgi:7,8-dihydropterin-6-yl-methyl-4-(beta-D-ribofuranosyl)aminobenzene 5'-phosphate synthase|nr:MBL fold metallo-hydrolase [Smithella sp.]HNZ11664.1 MBL fold metallo-hydrolase [Smithellaceae bacterium]HOQ42243.1 MBL fold metallo-hydrolase [Smithellaceae bacterium]HPL67493.1 MBL fold metallo-hydrolase [Smithellaceae bacterium]HQP24293.1 MBL fold metallo-hydrolase [Smithellaceae bacterium]
MKNEAMKNQSFAALNHHIVTIVCDNYKTRDDLDVCWGFSCLIRHGGKNVLFDTGSDGIVLSKNMARLGIDPASIDLLIISHQHWDHTGGIYYILDANRNLQISVPKSFSMHFKSDMKRYGAKLIESEGVCEIFPGLFTTGELDGPVKEQAALLKTDAGTVVITGCAHPGIVRIVEIAQKILPENDLALVMGGFHLLNDGNEEILSIIKRFQSLGVRYAAASHCSGERARKLFARKYAKRFIRLGAGSIIGLEDLK